MNVLVVGSIGLDTVETPFGRATEALGGSAVYFSVAASYFAPVRLVAVVGEDFPRQHLDFLEQKQIDLKGLMVEKRKTFRWGGRYHFDLNTRETLFTHLNVFETFNPIIPDSYRDSQYVFLANIDPELQLSVLKQIDRPRLVAMDTMNFWIQGKSEALKKTLAAVDILIINDSEARELALEPNLVKAARRIHELGPKIIVIKKGEHGALMLSQDFRFWAPAYPLETIYDPTGAGDTFAGGFMGYLAKTDDISAPNLRRAVIYGSTIASFCVENFSVERLRNLTQEEIRARFFEFKEMTRFEASGQ